jgi:hypothetical protein
VATAETNLPPWLASREAVARVARHLGCAPEDAWLRIVEEAEAGRIKARGLTVKRRPTSLLPASWCGIDRDAGSLPSYEIANIKLRRDDLIAADRLPGRPEGRIRRGADQTLLWIIRRELRKSTSEMGKEIKPAQLKLNEAIAAHRINLWGRQPGSSQFEPISNDLFSLPKYKVVVTLHGNLSTEPPRKQHDFEKEYERECGWHTIIFAEDQIRREWLPAGRAALSDSKPKSPLERPLEAESIKPMPATIKESPAAEPARLVSVKAQRQAQATKRKAQRKAKKNSRITAAAAWAKDKPNLTNAEVREKPPSKKVDLYTECAAAVPNLTYNEFKAGLKIERRKRAEAEAAARKS